VEDRDLDVDLDDRNSTIRRMMKVAEMQGRDASFSYLVTP